MLKSKFSFDILYVVDPRFVKDFSSHEKDFIYQIVRLVAIANPSAAGWIFEDLNSLLTKRGYDSDRYFYLKSLTDNQFIYKLDCDLDIHSRKRRDFYSQLKGRFGVKQLTIEEVLSKYFFCDAVEITRRICKRKIRRKGYSDHGSLGSEISKTLKQQSCDWSIREAEERRLKELDDRIKFLQALDGWI
jgi:hypothetical protein